MQETTHPVVLLYDKELEVQKIIITEDKNT